MPENPRLSSKYDLLPPEAWHYYQTHPLEFIENMILKPHTERRGKRLFLSDQQKEVIIAIGENGKVSTLSGKGIGKSFMLANIAIWFVSVFPEAQVVLTAPSSKTLKSGLWKEVKKWIIGSYVEALFTMTSEKLYMDVEESLDSFPSFVEMRTATKGSPESMAGIHTENLLLMADEASRVDDEILQVLQDTLTSGANNKMIMTSNGTRNSGFFYDSHMDDRANMWTKFKFSAEDSPFTSKESILGQELKFGRDSNMFIVNVVGGFSKEDPDSFLNAHDVACAFDRDVTPMTSDEIEIGVDVARFGNDRTVLFWRHGMKVFPPVERGKTSTVEVCDMVYELIIKIRIQTGYKDTIRVKVDDTGVGCLTKPTLVLTPTGWIKAEDVKVGDEIYSKDINGNMVVEYVTGNVERELTKVIRVNDEYEFSSHHMVPYKTRKEYDHKLDFWYNISDKKSILFDTEHSGWNVDGYGITFPTYEIEMPNGGFKTIHEEVTPDRIKFARFLGWYVSEGSQDSDSILITQVKEDNFEDIISSMECFGSKVKRKKNDFVLYRKDIAKWLKTNCYVGDSESKAWNKCVPKWVIENDIEVIEAFLDAFRLGDGYLHKGVKAYVTTSKTLAGQLQDLSYKCGRTSKISIKSKKGSKSHIFGREITRGRDCYVVEDHKRSALGLQPKSITERMEHVHYITITGDTKLFITKMDDFGRFMWTHNGGVTDLLNTDRDHNIEVVPCNFGGKGDDTYANEASVMWGTVRDVIQRVSLPSEEECENYTHAKYLREELSARRVDYGTGKTKIEPKANFKKDFGRSPDYADALVLCFARKKNERSFLTDFDHLSDQYVVKGMTYLSGLEHYVSVHYTSDRQASVIWSYWGNGTLYIVNEAVTDDNVARVASEIQARSPQQPIKVLGNSRCFGSPSQDIRAQLRKFRVRLRENYKYDELGALELLNQLVSTRSIKLVKSCSNTINQMDRWTSDVSKSQAEKDFGLCYAILNVVSELKDKINPAMRKKVEQHTPYSSNMEAGNTPDYNKALAW